MEGGERGFIDGNLWEESSIPRALQWDFSSHRTVIGCKALQPNWMEKKAGCVLDEKGMKGICWAVCSGGLGTLVLKREQQNRICCQVPALSK